MAESVQDNQPTSPPDPMADFGANEWLVDEMYERFQKDPNSVDRAWWEFFKVAGRAGHRRATAPSDEGARPEAAPAAAKAPAKPERSPAAPARPKTETPDRCRAARPPQKPKSRPAQPKRVQGLRRSTTRRTPPRHQPPGAQGERARRPRPRRATSRQLHRPARRARAHGAEHGRSASPCPTATSVRTVPVKLLIDNRIVINNHLARARGGKVSFTHLIGYALVKALREMPEMNNGFDVVDGKPNLVQPAHINLGLAIDMQKADGTRQLLVPSIKAAETHGLRRSSGRPTRTSSAGPATTSSRSRTSRAPRSA